MATLLAPWLAAGCAGSDVDANPLYVGRVWPSDAGEAARASVGGPFWEDLHEPGRHETALRPLWRRVVTPDETRIQVLAPIYASRTTNDETSHRLLALSFARTHRSGGSRSDYDFMLFPLLFTGNGPTEEERYFAFFPLFGQIKSFAGFAEAGFVLFPLYYWTRKEVTSTEKLHNVTPLVGWADGGPRDGSWRVLPLAGHWQYAGKYDKWSFLWPIFHWQRNRLDTGDPSRLVTVWPLFSIERSERMRFLTFLWPFFRFRTERVPSQDEAGRPYEEVYYHQDFLWPLFRRQHDRGHDYLRLFPFYARFTSEDLDSQTWLMPLFWKRQTRDRDYVKDTFNFVPFVAWSKKRWRPREGEPARPDDVAFRLWPLWSHGRIAGGEEWVVPALLPLDIGRYTGDFIASWGPFFELWHTRRDASGDLRGNALFRLVDWERRGRRSRFSIPLLYSGDYGPTRSTHSLLLGIFRFGGGEGGAELRFLGMPILTPETRAP